MASQTSNADRLAGWLALIVMPDECLGRKQSVNATATARGSPQLGGSLDVASGANQMAKWLSGLRIRITN